MAIQARNHGRPARAVLAEHVDADQLEADADFLLNAETTDIDGVVALPGRRGRPRAAHRPGPWR